MDNKKVIAGVSALCLVLACVSGIMYYNKHSDNGEITHNTEINNIQEKDKAKNTEKTAVKTVEETEKTVLQKASVQKEDEFVKNADMYDNLGTQIPLSAITVISTLPKTVREKVTDIAESNNIYMVQKTGDKILVITENPANIRHNIEFVEISLVNGHQVKTTLGYNDKMQDSDNDIWEYDKETKQPTRHTKYNSDGDMEFVEVWNYDGNPVKYEMKDADGKIISIRKETQNGASDLRVEHLVYDKSGNTKINVSTTYEGADVKRFTYYNSDKPSLGGSVFAEYSDDGLKTRETVYTSDLKVKNTYTSVYKDGNRDEIKILDNNNREIQILQSSNHQTDL